MGYLSLHVPRHHVFLLSIFYSLPWSVRTNHLMIVSPLLSAGECRKQPMRERIHHMRSKHSDLPCHHLVSTQAGGICQLSERVGVASPTESLPTSIHTHDRHRNKSEKWDAARSHPGLLPLQPLPCGLLSVTSAVSGSTPGSEATKRSPVSWATRP